MSIVSPISSPTSPVDVKEVVSESEKKGAFQAQSNLQHTVILANQGQFNILSYIPGNSLV